MWMQREILQVCDVADVCSANGGLKQTLKPKEINIGLRWNASFPCQWISGEVCRKGTFLIRWLADAETKEEGAATHSQTTASWQCEMMKYHLTKSTFFTRNVILCSRLNICSNATRVYLWTGMYSWVDLVCHWTILLLWLESVYTVCKHMNTAEILHNNVVRESPIHQFKK